MNENTKKYRKSNLKVYSYLKWTYAAQVPSTRNQVPRTKFQIPRAKSDSYRIQEPRTTNDYQLCFDYQQQLSTKQLLTNDLEQ